MTPESWERIDELFGRAVDLPATERAEFLNRECGEDDELRAELAALLESDVGARARLVDAVAREAQLVASETELVGKRIGPYRIVALLGEGGMGAVYRAIRDDAEYQHDVAIKIVRYGLGSPAAIARFRDERQILAGLEHPGIVRLLDGGRTEDGAPYLVMELVDGQPITAFARTRPVRERIELFRRVCEAVQYAHGKLVVHRDLKPSNILVDRDSAPKLLDFGIAKLLDPIATREAKTRTGGALLTPEYASPEQARGLAVSVATDVYSLGAVLYEVLAGRPALAGDTDPLEQLRQICEVDPPRPSSVASIELRREIEGDLDNIVLRALHKDPVRRYASVEALADDLARYLDGFPVAARAGTFGYRASKLVRRHRGKLALAAATAVALSAATVISIRQARRADEQAERAERKFDDVRKLANALLLELDGKLQYVAGATDARRAMVTRALEYLDRLASEAGTDPSLSRELATAYMKIGDIQGNGYEPNLGQSLQGLESYRKARSIVDGLVASGHDDLETRKLAAHAWFGVGILEHSAERPKEAFATLSGALANAATLPAPVDIDRYVMRAHLSMSYLHGEVRGEMAESEAYTRKLIDLARAARDATNSEDAHYWVGVAMTRAGQQRMDAADPDAACPLLEDAQKEYDELYRRRPDDARFVRERAYGLEILAGCFGGVSNIEIWRAHNPDLERARKLLNDAIPLAE